MRIDKVCEWCGKTYSVIPAKARRSRFCSFPCKQRYMGRQQTIKATIIRACLVCGKEYQTTQHHGGRKTCSKECGYALISQQAVQRTKYITIYCRQCGNPKKILPGHKNRIHFCSRECRIRWIANDRIGKKTSSQLVICPMCHKEFFEYASRIKMYKQYFCSAKCYHEWDKIYKNEEIIKARLREATISRLANGGQPKISSLENIVAKWFDEKEIQYERQICIGQKAVDFIFQPLCVLEVNGDYWHRRPKTVARDQRFKEFCEKHKIPLFIIWESEIKSNDFTVLQSLSRFLTTC